VSGLFSTFSQANYALACAELDVVGDFGPEAWLDAQPDIVRQIAEECTEDVAEELLRRHGLPVQ